MSIHVDICNIYVRLIREVIFLYFFSTRYLGKKYFKTPVSHKSLYHASIVINHMTEYNKPTSATGKEFEMIVLEIYPSGRIINEKKYNQNHLVMSFLWRDSSGSKSFIVYKVKFL